MNILKSILLAISVCAASALACAAQDSCVVLKPVRAVTASYSIEAGSSHLADTYLTPLHYRGEHLAFNYERLQPMAFDPRRWMMQLRAGIDLDRADSSAGNSTMDNAEIDLAWAMLRRWQPVPHLTIAAGGEIAANAGVLYHERNGNNPASAKVAANIGITAMAVYRTHIGPLLVDFVYRPSLPITGVFFSPDYGELYYQIYMGQRSGLTHAAWWGNYFSMENLAAADMHIGNTAIRIGYRGRILSTKVNDIVTRDISHSVVLGITTSFFSIPAAARSISVPEIYTAY